MRSLVTLGPAAPALLLAVALAGCGGGDDTDLPTFTGGASASPAASATSGPEPTGGTGGALPAAGEKLGDPKNPITVGRVVRGDAAEEAVQQAYLDFWAVRATALRRAEVDDTAVARVATGQAAERIVLSVREVAGEDHHTEGGSTVHVQTVTVTGSTATLVDCFDDRSIDLTADGKPAEQPDFGVAVYDVELVRSGDAWKVSEVSDSDFTGCRRK